MRQLRKELGVGFLYDIAAVAAERMSDDMDRGQEESDLFNPNGTLTDAGDQYLEEAIPDVMLEADTVCELCRAFDRQLFLDFKRLRAATKHAAEQRVQKASKESRVSTGV